VHINNTEVIELDYPKYERLVVTVLPRHMEYLNRVFLDDGTNRSEQTRQALDLLMSKSKVAEEPNSIGIYEKSLTAEEMDKESVVI